ncbi:hypothetical protein DsansV1_C10g0100881 [Dioscorea sansibarensis]
MPCGHGRISNNAVSGANGRHHSLPKRSLDHSNHKYSLKESEVSALVLRNPDGRCIYFTLVAFGFGVPLNFLAPFFLPVQGSDKTYNLESGAQPDAGSLESSSPPPAVSFLGDLQKEQNMSECKGSAQSLLGQNLRPKTSGEFRKRNKRTKSVRNSSSNTSGNCLSPENSSGAFCDGASAVCSDILLPDVSKVSKPVKKNSRKKGKKKGKHSKQYIHRKTSAHAETQCVEGVSAASVSEASGRSSHSSVRNLSENSFSSGLSIEDINMEKDNGGENNIDLRNSIATVVEGRTCGTEMKDCEAPLLERSDDEDFSCTQSSTDEDSIWRSSVTVSPETPLSFCDENTSNGHLKGKSSYGVASSTSMDPHIAPVTDVSLGVWKSDIGENCIDDIEVQTPVKHENTVNSSAGNLVSDCRINGSLFQDLNVDLCEMSSDGSNNILDVRSGSERAQCSSEACHSNDFLPVYKKRGRLARKMDKKLNGVSEFGGSNIHGRSGKDNNHCVWQKVQKNDAKSLLMKLKEFSPPVNFASKRSETKRLVDTPLASGQNNVQKVSISTGLDEVSVQSYLMKAPSNVDSSDHPSKSTGGGFLDVTKGKPGLVPKQTNHSPRKGSNTFRTGMVRHSVIHIQQKDRLESPRQVNQNKLMNLGLVSPDNTEIQSLLAVPPDEPECHPSEQLQKNLTLMDEAKYAEDVGRVVYENDDKDSSLDEDDRISQLPNVVDASHVSQSEVYHDGSFTIMTRDMPDAISVISDSKSEKCAKSEMGYCHEEYIKKNSSVGRLSLKWVPLGSKDPVVFKDNHDNSLVSSFTDSTLAESSLQGLNQILEDADCTLSEADDCMSNFRSPAHVDGEFAGVSAVTDQVAHEVMDKCISEFRTDLNMIVKAVNDSYKLQTAAENVQLVYGSPIAEFERFLHFASPVLTQIDYIRSCKVCPKGQLPCEVLCPHQTPCISLGSFWQWYEKPGSYGLEVKVGAYNNLKRCQSHYGFHAYFVPYLSAVQLFGRCSSSLCRSNENPKVTETSGMHESTSLSLGSLPIFSKLLPRSCKVVDTSMPELASSSKEEFCNQTAKSTHLSDGELIFEYFESDQPQQRRPFNEKIKELVGGNKSSNCQIFGDPANLEHRHLHELHPASWYSVAWYPIYRIPDGNLRAAFLTYHSLGHFTHRRTSLKTSHGATALVSPVVGLQSYNTKGECWFQPKQFKQQVVQTEGVDLSDPSGILKERLRTLEQTASVMARASVQKDGRRSANRQPDYEFFVSRKW